MFQLTVEWENTIITWNTKPWSRRATACTQQLFSIYDAAATPIELASPPVHPFLIDEAYY
jgi:hypothetical protein